tara:strand:- start:299 stop:1240 length:942 start_codon:yes stop_codon:yes gene_type:complete
MNPFPILSVVDASCGVASTLKANWPEEEEELFGDHRGTFKPFLEESEILQHKKLPDLTPISIPDFELCAARRYANDQNGMRSVAVAAAREVMQAKGKLRLKRHPLQHGAHRYRAIISDKWHQSPYVLKRSINKKHKPHSHRKLSCTQHLAHVCSSLAQCRTSIMESLNARRTLHLSTTCTTDPVHNIVFVEKLRRFGNRRIIAKQDEALEKCLRDGERVIIDPDLGVARIVCSKCRQGGHRAPSCRSSEEGEEPTPVEEQNGAKWEAGIPEYATANEPESGLYEDGTSKSVAIVISVNEVQVPSTTPHNPLPP